VPPEQFIFVTVLFKLMAVGCVIVAVAVAEQPMPFVIVTVYVPSPRLLAVTVV